MSRLWKTQPGPFYSSRLRGLRFSTQDMLVLLLSLLESRPDFACGLIREIEVRSRGGYIPRSGSVYPALRILEERGYACVQVRDSQARYSITAEGRAFLDSEYLRKAKVMNTLYRIAQEAGQRQGSVAKDSAVMQELNDAQRELQHELSCCHAVSEQQALELVSVLRQVSANIRNNRSAKVFDS